MCLLHGPAGDGLLLGDASLPTVSLAGVSVMVLIMVALAVVPAAPGVLAAIVLRRGAPSGVHARVPHASERFAN